MAGKNKNITKLGIFVFTGIMLLIAALFLIGNYQHMFGSHYKLRANFSNVGGLKTGNNVRYAGVEVGTVKEMNIINDTTLEVTMLIEQKMKNVIRKNALASLGADGLLGNKVVNIVPQDASADFAVEGDILPSRTAIEFDDILRTLSGTSDNLGEITNGLKETVTKINKSDGLWKLLSDSGMAVSVRKASKNIERATVNAEMMTRDVKEMIADVKAGKGTAGAILRDTMMVNSLKTSLSELEQVAGQASQLAAELDAITENINKDIQEGPGPVHTALKDTAIAGNISRSLTNIEKGTEAFNQNMEAAKHNFLFRGYFKKQEKEKAKQQKQKQDSLQKQK
jgi:phospholipid/cholesterol/gamma-HCH transport system substrate-binding protein